MRRSQQGSTISSPEKVLAELSNDLKTDITCSLCQNPISHCITLLPCLHNFCSSCSLQHWLKSDLCPVCQLQITNFKKNKTLDKLIKKLSISSPSSHLTKESEIEASPKELKSITYEDGRVYYGYCNKNEKREGQGKLKNPDGTIESGEWVNDKLEGAGMRTYKDGKSYQGAFKDGMREGLGTSQWKNGESYCGMHKEDRIEGSGTCTYEDGSVYKGDVKNGLKNGKGRLEKKKDGVVYEATWEDGQMTGKGGRIEYKDGSSYEGEWKVKNGEVKRDGKGKMVMNDGRVEEGRWKNDEMVKEEMGLKGLWKKVMGSLFRSQK